MANLDAFLERARPYAVKGLKRFARDLGKAWASRDACAEGHVDAEDSAIELVTMHSAKGLEWPVIIPINTATLRRSPEPFVHRPSDDTLHWVLGEVAPPDLRLAMQVDDESLAREQERLLYVACTRARDLLILPQLPGAGQNSWARMVDLARAELPVFDVAKLQPGSTYETALEPPNRQTAEIFEAEAATIAEAITRLTWLRPSDHDPDRIPLAEAAALEVADAPEAEIPVGPGRIRGLILHKLMEEILTGEIEETLPVLAKRAETLISELAVEQDAEAEAPAKEEIAATALRTLQLPDIAVLRNALVPELPVYDMLDEDARCTALAGRADAIALEAGEPSVVLDWKSDVAPTSEDISMHAGQLRHYMAAVGAARGALVYMTPGTVHWVEAEPRMSAA
jgi:CRISPR-associated exonuclease Cas4